MIKQESIELLVKPIEDRPSGIKHDYMLSIDQVDEIMINHCKISAMNTDLIRGKLYSKLR